MSSVSQPLPARYRGPREEEATLIACAVGGAGLAGAVSPVAEAVLGVVVVGGPVVTGLVWVVRRELRIRRRLRELDGNHPTAAPVGKWAPGELTAAPAAVRS